MYPKTNLVKVSNYVSKCSYKKLGDHRVYIYISAVKQLIVINRIQNKCFCLHNICVCTVYIYYVFIHTHSCLHLRKICYIYILHIFIYKLYEYKYIHVDFKIYIILYRHDYFFQPNSCKKSCRALHPFNLFPKIFFCFDFSDFCFTYILIKFKYFKNLHIYLLLNILVMNAEKFNLI